MAVVPIKEAGEKPGPFASKDAFALAEVLAYIGMKLRYNLRSGRVEYRKRRQVDWTPFNDRAEDLLRESIGSDYSYVTTRGVSPLRYGREAWTSAVNANVANAEVDPFLTWLEALDKWDGTPRIDTILTDLFGADDVPITRWASRYPLMGAVQRAMWPGVQARYQPDLPRRPRHRQDGCSSGTDTAKLSRLVWRFVEPGRAASTASRGAARQGRRRGRGNDRLYEGRDRTTQSILDPHG